MTDKQKIGEALARLLMKPKWRFEIGRQLRGYNVSHDQHDMEGIEKVCEELGGLLLQILQESGVDFDRF